MCDPVTIGVTLAVVSSAATIAQQQQAANAENDYQKLVYGQKKAQVFEQWQALREREYQERTKAAGDIQRLTSQARMATSAAKLQALESGTGGQSVSALLAQFERNQLTNVGVVESNLKATTQQIRREERAAGYIMGPAQAFGPLDSGLGIAASGLQVASSGFNAYQATKPPAK